ncbi:MAG: hypothetical protein LBI72_08505 [Flavobacteriaceae bacterium]|jgi:hypothetical protein|nr:hypothetical protein [Flavobacteriaceae bacterium]
MQYTIEEHLLTLQVKPAPLLLRSTLFGIGGLMLLGTFFLLLSFGKNSTIGLLFFSLIFLLGGLFLFRLALWNTFGKEKIYFFKNSIQYRAYYGWYKSKLKTYTLVPNKEFQFDIKRRGYEDEKRGVLHIRAGSGTLLCATMLPIEELERIIVELQGVLYIEKESI